MVMAEGTAVLRRNRPGTKATDFYNWPDESFEEMDSTLAVQQYIQQNIRSDCSNIDKILEPPEGQDEGVWKYEHLRQFCLELNGLAVKLQSECHPDTCTQMTATEQWIFLCAAHKTPKECPAIDYTRHTLDGAACLLNSNKYFPSRVSIKESSVAKLGSVCRRIYRIFSHAYFHHRQIFDKYEIHTRCLCPYRFTLGVSVRTDSHSVSLSVQIHTASLSVQIHTRCLCPYRFTLGVSVRTDSPRYLCHYRFTPRLCPYRFTPRLCPYRSHSVSLSVQIHTRCLCPYRFTPRLCPYRSHSVSLSVQIHTRCLCPYRFTLGVSVRTDSHSVSLSVQIHTSLSNYESKSQVWTFSRHRHVSLTYDKLNETLSSGQTEDSFQDVSISNDLTRAPSEKCPERLLWTFATISRENVQT
ncbi:hypothetical protein JOB18_027210 [Solea senegalensis]|uniref:MOB-like protein phocein n=1 Tax=Solea senegalensis TaxID=28829 RepID=A0AAV6RFS8_SOLSE|nr:hypothetical protein JOB18_027210 [Solea senegalensis]